MRRSAVAIAAAGLLGLSLTGCAGVQPVQDFATAAAAQGCKVAASGAVVDSLQGAEKYGTFPQKLSLQKGLSLNKSEVRVIAASKAERSKIAKTDWLVDVQIAAYDAKTGKQLYKGQGAEPVLAGGKSAVNPLGAAVLCTVPGDRVIAGVGGQAGQGMSMQLGGSGNGIILVMDVSKVSPSEAQGAIRPLPNGFPEVVKDSKQNFGVVLPPTGAPTKTTSAVRIAGNGRAVTANDMLIVRGISLTWDGEVEGQGITQYGPETGGPAFRAQLTGKHVGDEVVIIDTSEKPTVRVIVVDILSALDMGQQ